jgi:hypothetical protein
LWQPHIENTLRREALAAPPFAQPLLHHVERICDSLQELSTPQAVRDFLKHRLAGIPHEVFVGILLDAQNRVLHVVRGTRTYLRQVVNGTATPTEDSRTRWRTAFIQTHKPCFGRVCFARSTTSGGRDAHNL